MIPSVVVPVTFKEITTALAFNLHNNKVKEFEKVFSEFIGCEHAITTSSGICSLYVLLRAYGLNRGDEVVVPAYTCESVPRLIIDMGLKVNFVDIDKETYNISINDLKSKISENTKVVVPVHMFGNPCEMDEIMATARDYNAVVIEDSAQCIGAEYKGKKTGTIGDAGFFSLNEGKPITTMGGGVIVTDNEQIAERARNIIEGLKTYNTSQKCKVASRLFTYYLIKNPYCYRLIHNYIASRRNNRREKLKIPDNLNFNFKYTNMQASVGLVQLSKLEDFNDSRIKNANFLKGHMNFNGVNLPNPPGQSIPVFLRYPVCIENISEEKRDNLIKKLKEEGIDAPIAYPNSLPRFFMDKEGFPNTEEVIKKTITLPTHPYVKEEVLKRATDTIKNFLGD